MRDHPLILLALAAALGLSLALTGCGGDDDNPEAIEVDVDEIATATFTPPALTYAPRVVGLFIGGGSAPRAPVEILGNIPLVTSPTLDTPDITNVNNQVVVGSGQLLNLVLTWTDLGSDVNRILFELRTSQAVTEGPRYMQFDVPELVGLADDVTTIDVRMDPLNHDAGYEYVLALQDAAGNISTIIRGVFILTELALDPQLAAATANLRGAGGHNPPNLGPEQNWFPTGGETVDSIPDGLEGAIPVRVAGDIAMNVKQPVGTNAIGLQDYGAAIPRTGWIYGEEFEFTYLIPYLSIPENGTCGSVWAHLGSGLVIDEDRESREDKRLEVNEVRVLLGTFQPNAANFELRGATDPVPEGCAGVPFPTMLVNDFVVFVR
jgi:hypothetical protein